MWAGGAKRHLQRGGLWQRDRLLRDPHRHTGAGQSRHGRDRPGRPQRAAQHAERHVRHGEPVRVGQNLGQWFLWSRADGHFNRRRDRRSDRWGRRDHGPACGRERAHWGVGGSARPGFGQCACRGEWHARHHPGGRHLRRHGLYGVRGHCRGLCHPEHDQCRGRDGGGQRGSAAGGGLPRPPHGAGVDQHARGQRDHEGGHFCCSDRLLDRPEPCVGAGRWRRPRGRKGRGLPRGPGAIGGQHGGRAGVVGHRAGGRRELCRGSGGQRDHGLGDQPWHPDLGGRRWH